MEYGKMNAQELSDLIATERPDAWAAAAKAWGKTAVLANNVEAGISSASGEITVWQQSNDSKAEAAFDQRITRDLDVLKRWNQFGVIVMLRLQAVASVLAAAQPAMRGFADARAEQIRIRDAAADDVGARNTASTEIDRLNDLARGRMQLVAQLMKESLTDKDPERPGRWVGPRAAPGGPVSPEAPGTGDGAQAPGAGGPGADAGGPGADAGGGGAAPGDASPGTPEQPSSPKTPEEKDPVEEAGKLIDVIGKGIDLTGKVPENLDKWLTLAQHGKDLLGADTPSTTIPDDSSSGSHGLPVDEPALAGSTGAEPVLNPTHYAPSTPHSSLGGGGLGSIGLPITGGGGGHTGLPGGTTERGTASLRSATTAGSTGAEPTLSGRTATTAATGTQSGTPSMYPPMNGAGASAPTARGEIRPGAAASKPGFAVPTEPTASERLSRQGVQSDLQGRTNNERRTASGAPPPLKRRRSALSRRAATEDVLDEELWKL
ncbi:hypothetical protein [Kribbella sp. NPDC003557]|uniref:hypothetical protein n=1 Tax=Kribbella sp. NPDC003557 TaxID=3154449 RepID=UPI0033B6244D